MASPKIKGTAVTIIVILLVGLLGYKILNKEPAVIDPTQATADDNAGVIGQEILNSVERLEVIVIDQKFLQGNLFASLRDFSQPIFGEPYGRINPFAPIGSDSFLPVNVPNTAQSTTTGGVR